MSYRAPFSDYPEHEWAFQTFCYPKSCHIPGRIVFCYELMVDRSKNLNRYEYDHRLCTELMNASYYGEQTCVMICKSKIE